MQRLAGLFAFAAVVALCPSGSALAQAAEQPIRIERIESVIDLQPDGQWTQEIVQRFKIQTQAGLQGGGQMVFPHNLSMQKFDVLEAFTAKANGTRVTVKPEAIFQRDLPATAGAPMFADIKVDLVVFPDIAVGDSIEARVRYQQVEPMFPGQFSNLWFAMPHFPLDSVRIMLRAPRTLAIRVSNEGYAEKRSVEGDSAIYEWTTSNTVVEPMEAGSVSPLDYSHRLSVSTFPDFASMAQAYAARANDKAVVTPAIKKLADELTSGTNNPGEQARRIYDWVAQNIRYVGIFLGAGAVVPHPADQVLSNRYGDCKDHVTLMTAMLAAKGIEARTAIVSAGNSYWVGKLPLLPNFNHVILYLPGLDAWADPTSTITPFGRLPTAVQGKTVVLAPSGELRTTPVDKSSDNVTLRRVRYEIQPDGSIKASSQIEAKGVRAEAYRDVARQLTAEKVADYVRRTTTGARYKGEGSVTFTGVAERSDKISLAAAYTLTGGIDWPGSGSFEVPAGFRGNESVSTQVRQNATANKLPRVSGGVETLIEEYEIVLPPKMKVIALPKPVSFKNEVASYETTVRQEGDRLFVTRKLVDLYAGPVKSPSLFKADEEKSAVISRDLRAQIVFEEK
jgi:transglutaminase-like putative cysteine protease